MKPLVIYHKDCADGFGAAFAAWLKFGDGVEYLPMQYGQEARMVGLTCDVSFMDRDVYILDFSFSRLVMETVFADAKRVVWLDHHKTAFEMWANGEMILFESGSDIGQHYIKLDNNKSGALLAWEYFHPDKEVPMLIKHIDDYDRRQFKIEGTKEFNKALWSFEQWANWVNHKGTEQYNFYAEGAAILRAHDANVKAVVEGARRKCMLKLPNEPGFEPEGLTFFGLAANCPPHLASDVGHALANKSGTYGLCWHIDKEGKCKCSLRSNRWGYDVSAIAKAFGGGGHKNAAGFEIDIKTLLEWIK